MDTLFHHELWPYVSTVIGWGYFLAWSVSFYPQFILNYKRKSVQGVSLDFLYLNVVGFFCYSIYNLSFYYSKQIQDEYKDRNDNNENLVRFNDVIFAIHAFLISLLTLMQTFIYKRDISQKLSYMAQYFLLGSFITVMIQFYLLYSGRSMLLDLMYHLSYIKLVISLIKYIPQAWVNYKRESTVGWSIHNILLDFTGGSLSMIQLFLDAFITNDWSGISGNPVKLGLSVQSMAFDVLFMLQHYVFYRDRTDTNLHTVDEERRRLIVEGRVPRTPEDEENHF